MNRSARPPKKIEVESGNLRLRVVLLAVCLLLAVIFITRGLTQLFSKETGWQQVEISTKEVNCSTDFTLNYDFGRAGITASAEYRQISALYTEACVECYRFFHREGELSNIVPNETVTVSEPLYNALEMIQKAGNRSLYLAPVYAEYDRIFLCETEAEAALYDPARDPDLAAYVAKTAAFCSDPDMIDLELSDGSVCLRISDEYLAYAEENGIEEFIDFGWMKNAFIADHMADKLAEGGFTNGYIASFDGFTRNLDDSGRKYSQNIFARQEHLVDMPAVMEYEGPMSIVFLRDHPMGEADRWHYFAFSDGKIASVYLDPADGLPKASVSDLVVCSAEKSCAALVLEAAPLWLTEELDEQALGSLDSVSAVWHEGTELRSCGGITLKLSGDSGYTAKSVS